MMVDFVSIFFINLAMELFNQLYVQIKNNLDLEEEQKAKTNKNQKILFQN